MTKQNAVERASFRRFASWLLFPAILLARVTKRFLAILDKAFVSYIRGRVLRGARRIYSIRFVWYGDSVYLHPMIWGSAVLYALALGGVSTAWLLLLWFMALVICFLTIMYNFDIVRTAILGTGVVALLGAAYFSTVEWSWNPLAALRDHVTALDATVSPGFFLVASYVFTLLILSEIVWSWLFHRVEIDESYVYERQFLQATTREPIFARGLKRETKDLLELLLLGAADIQHRTKKGFKRFRNVPFASLWLGKAIDSLLDYRRDSQIQMEASENADDLDEQARISDAIHDQEMDDFEDDSPLDEGDFEADTEDACV